MTWKLRPWETDQFEADIERKRNQRNTAKAVKGIKKLSPWDTGQKRSGQRKKVGLRDKAKSFERKQVTEKEN
jgi:hypothetical protein